ncbi:unnamed protein product [Rhizophagus irregularis]|uniref:Uncharacterized protein n=1 Tax=Rhizophagus irregularis TaxID=588596 RepID=A0A915ZR82_9GLOM|nr:unnamed protein product [Rhizophagus irregularis]
MFGDRRTRLKIFRLEAMAKNHAFYYTNTKKELLFYGKELLETSEPISESSCDSQNLQSDDDNGINDTNLSIEEIVDLSNPAFIGNN